MNIKINNDFSEVIAQTIIKTVIHFNLNPSEKDIEDLVSEITNSEEIKNAMKNMTKIN